MAQFLRPSSDITNPGTWTGDYTDINEASPDDGDYGVSDDRTAVIYETLLDTGAIPTVDTGHIVRIRHAKSDTGVPPSTNGNSQTVDFYLYQGGTIIQTLATGVTLGAWTTANYNITEGNAANITDYSDLRVRVDVPQGGGGAPGNRRGCAVSWVEMEIPDGPVYDGGIFKRYDGSWVKAKVMVYNGASWDPAVVKKWSGSAWEEVDATGI